MSDNEHAHDEHADGPYGEAEVHAHIGSYRGYFAVLLALLLFTMLTWAVAGIHLGRANLAVAVVIASIKASLVCTFFMHLKDDNRFNTLILISAITFIGVFFALTLDDVDHRHMLDNQAGNRVLLQSGENAPGSWVNPIKVEEPTSEEEAPTATAPAATAAAPPVVTAAPAATAATSAAATSSAAKAPASASAVPHKAAPHASATAAPHATATAAPHASASAP